MEAQTPLRTLRPSPRVRALLAALLLLAASGAAAGFAYQRLGLAVGPEEYNVAGWEVRALPGKWLYAFGRLFRSQPTQAEEDEALRRFFRLTAEIEALERAPGVANDAERAAQLAEKRRQRQALENQVEATIEGRLTAVLEREGVQRRFLFLTLVWPPVDFEFTEAPRTLALSPRERIELVGTRLLREGLSLAEVEAIEAREEARGRSALAFATGGIGAYPTIVDYTDDYRAAVELVAHEWTHNYLFFRPLGFNYYKSYELRALNETVADLVARELAQAVVAAWPLVQEAPAAREAPPAGPDLGAELRRLRGEVDALLAAGRVAEAEALMEQRRRELVTQGANIRKLNQAYFAYTNLYAGEAGHPAATNPIGPKVDELRRLSTSLREFIEVAGGLTSVEALDAALAQRR